MSSSRFCNRDDYKRMQVRASALHQRFTASPYTQHERTVQLLERLRERRRRARGRLAGVSAAGTQGARAPREVGKRAVSLRSLLGWRGRVELTGKPRVERQRRGNKPRRKRPRQRTSREKPRQSSPKLTRRKRHSTRTQQSTRTTKKSTKVPMCSTATKRRTQRRSWPRQKRRCKSARRRLTSTIRSSPRLQHITRPEIVSRRVRGRSPSGRPPKRRSSGSGKRLRGERHRLAKAVNNKSGESSWYSYGHSCGRTW